MGYTLKLTLFFSRTFNHALHAMLNYITYRFLLYKHHLFDMHKHNNLTSRVKETCNSNELSFLRNLFDDSYVFKCKKKLTNF